MTLISDCTEELHLIGDGYCHDQLNNIECSFDAGDCCNGATTKCTDFPVALDWFADGICDSDLNTEVWGYDGADCCTCDEVGPGTPCQPKKVMEYCDITSNCDCKRPQKEGVNLSK